MFSSIKHSPASLLILLNFAYAVNAQTYRRRTRSPARIIIGAIIGGLALLFFLCAIMMFTRRRRAATRVSAIPRPHVGEQPYVGPHYQQYGPPGSPPGVPPEPLYMQETHTPWQQQPYGPAQGTPMYPSPQSPYPPPHQAQYGGKRQDSQLPPYTKERDVESGLQPQSGILPNNSVQPPPPAHASGNNAQNGGFIGGFRAPHSP